MSRKLKESELGSRDNSRDKISPKIASIQQQLVNLTSPTSDEAPTSLVKNDAKIDDREGTMPFKLKSDTLSRKNMISNSRENRSWGRDDSGFSYKGEIGIPPPPPPPRSSIPKGHNTSSPIRTFTSHVSSSQSVNNRPANPATFKLPLKTESDTSPVKKSPSMASPMSISKLRNTSSSDSLSSNASVNTVKSVSPMEEKGKHDSSALSKTTFGVKLSPIKDTKDKEDIQRDDDEESNPPSLPPRLSSPVKSPSKQPLPPPKLIKSPSKDKVPPPSPKPAVPSRAKKPSPVHTPQGNTRTSPSSSNSHNLGSRSLPQLPKSSASNKSSAASSSPVTSPKIGAKFAGQNIDHNGASGPSVKRQNGSSMKYIDDEKPTLPQKTLNSNDRSSAGRRLPIPPPTNSGTETNGSSSDGSVKNIPNGRITKASPHLTNGNTNHENHVPPTPPSPRSKPRGVSGSPLRINQSPNKSTTTTIISSSSNTPARKFEFGSKKNGFIEGSYRSNGHLPNGHSTSSSQQNELVNGKHHKMQGPSVESSHSHHGDEEIHRQHSEVYSNSQFDVYGDGTSVDGEDHVDYNDQHDNEVSYVVQNGVNGNLLFQNIHYDQTRNIIVYIFKNNMKDIE